MTPSHRSLADGSELAELLGRLELRSEDAADFRAGLARLDDADWARVDDAVGRLRDYLPRLGDIDNPLSGLDLRHPVGINFLALVAFVAQAPAVAAAMISRGVGDTDAWKSLSDIGQQAHICREVHRSFGLESVSWVAQHFNGSLLWLGRLQFALEPDDEFGHVVSVHIPEAGPLTPVAVDDSIARLVALMHRAFAGFDLTRATCHSWLLDRNLLGRLDPASNMARFGVRFTPYGTPSSGIRDALFFGFHRETAQGQRVDLDALPQDTSLQRAALAMVRDGSIVCQSGWFWLPGRSPGSDPYR